MRHLVLVYGLCHFAGMAEIVNLRRVKRQRARDLASQDAAAARARHGRTRAEREVEAWAGRMRDAALDGARLEGSAGDREPSE